MLTAEQKEIRKTGLGGSDIAAVAGVNPYRGPMDVYLEKLGLVEEQPENEAMYWGSALEDKIIERYKRDHKCNIHVPQKTFRHKDPNRPYLLATPDAFVFANGNLLEGIANGFLLEIKTAGLATAKLFGEEGTDQVPEHYLCQCQHYMGVLDKDRCDLAVLIAGQQYREYPIHRNDAVIAALWKQAERFWFDNVQAKIPPPVDGSKATKAALAKIYPAHVEDFLETSMEIEELVSHLKEAKIEAGLHNTSVTFIENQIKALLKDKQGVITQAGKITWRKAKDGTKTDYKGIVKHLKPDKAIISQFTVPKQGARRFLTPPSWKKGE